jgi:hypothetical protein
MDWPRQKRRRSRGRTMKHSRCCRESNAVGRIERDALQMDDSAQGVSLRVCQCRDVEAIDDTEEP